MGPDATFDQMEDSCYNVSVDNDETLADLLAQVVESETIKDILLSKVLNYVKMDGHLRQG